MRRNYLAAAIAVATLTATPSLATAQSGFDGFVVFGDSLLDSGNFGTTFTNDGAPIAVDIFAEELGLPLGPAIPGPDGTNFAVGGFETPDVLNSISGTGISTLLGSRNAFLVDNPTVSSDTLFLVNGGGNDFNPGGAITWALEPDPVAAIQNSAQTLVASISALSDAGARYIALANLPNLGNIPGVQLAELGFPGSIAGATAASEGFNEALTFFTRTTNIPVIPVDLAGLVDLIRDNADALGFANGVDVAITGAPIDQLGTCYDNGVPGVGASASCFEHPVFGIDGSGRDANRLIFNDGLHPTEATSELTADYLLDLFTAPRKVGLLPQMNTDVARTQVNVVTNQLRQSRWSKPQSGWFVSGAVGVNEPEGGFNPDNDTYSTTVGLTAKLSDTRVLGVAVTAAYSELDVNDAEFEADSYGLNIFFGYRNDRWFVDATLGLTETDFDDLERDFNFGPLTFVAQGDTDGRAVAVDVSAGYKLINNAEGYQLSPIIGIQSINSKIDSYTERGGEISNYAWGDQSTKSQQWRIGLAGSAQLSERLRVHGEIFQSEELEDELQTVEVTNPNLGFRSFRLPGAFIDDGSFVTANINGTWKLEGGNVHLTYHYSGQGDDSSQLSLSYSAPF